MTGTAPERPTRPSIRRRLVGILDTLHRWAESGWSGPATGAWGLAQGSVVPGPSEGLLIPLGLSDPPRALPLALWAWIGSTIGGTFAYALGAVAAQAASSPLEWVGVTAAELGAQRARFDEWGWWLIFGSTMSPLSTKIVCVAAGFLGYPIAGFVTALAVGRLLRFTAVAVLLRIFGERLARRMSNEPTSR